MPPALPTQTTDMRAMGFVSCWPLRRTDPCVGLGDWSVGRCLLLHQQFRHCQRRIDVSPGSATRNQNAHLQVSPVCRARLLFLDARWPRLTLSRMPAPPKTLTSELPP